MTAADLSGPEFTDDSALIAAPIEIKVSFWLWISEAVLTVVGALLIALVGAAIPWVTGASGDDAVSVVAPLIVIAVVLIAVAVLRIVAAVYMLRGRTWARNVLTILGVLGLFGTALDYSANVAVGVAHTLVALVALVLMFLPASNAYFRAPHPYRSRSRG
jgi:hypothetical protein